MKDRFKIDNNLIPSDPRFGCGPSLVNMGFLDSLLKTQCHLMGTSHRKPPVKNIIREIQEGLLNYFNVSEDYIVIIANGGATLAFDMLALGLVKKSIFHFVCGEFSKKWFMASKKVPWIDVGDYSVDFGKGVDVFNKEGFDVICGTLNETSTGVQLSNVDKVDDNTILAIDATSGAGQVPCNVNNVDIFFFSPQKVFASDGGIFCAIMSPKAVERALSIAQDKSRYIPDIMNFKTIIENCSKNQTYNTPPIANLYLLNQQIKYMNKEGYDKIVLEGKRRADLLYSWAKNHKLLNPYILEEKYRSNTIAAIDVDESIDVKEILSYLYQEKIVYNIESYRKLGRNQFRIPMFYNIKYQDLEKLTKLLTSLIDSF